ncbi:MAG: hypothetical protein ABSC62_05675 [Terracidiphilus sp.]|jgi:hypothetical protein
MRTVLSLALLVSLLTLTTFAKDKHPDSDYQDGTLVSFRTVSTGSSCSQQADTKGNVDDNGDVKASTSGSTNCSDDLVRYYTIRSGDSTLVIAPVVVFRSVLANRMPGATFRMRFDGKHVFVKIGDKESKFSIVEAAAKQ